MFNNVLLVIQAIAAAIGVYQIILSFFGWYRRKERITHKPTKSFALIVAAHNEEAVVGALIENLLKMDYPRELFDIFVICDNCTDGTADIVRGYEGVYACERTNPNERGKGFAIEWMLKELWKNPRQYDAIVMFDADNLVATNFLQYMNEDLCNGYRVVQGYLDTKNPHDSWISAANGITYWFCNRLWQLPRFNLKLSNFLGGTGMCFETKLLKEMGWGATSLVEDLEFTVRCIQRGIYPKFNYDARVYDEKPITFRASARQRLRWMQGHFDVSRRYMFPLLWQGIRTGSIVKIDAALYIFNAFIYLIGFLVTLALWFDMMLPGDPNLTSIYSKMPLGLSLTIVLYGYLQCPIAMLMEKVNWRMYLKLLLFPVFFLSWWPIAFYAFFTQNNKTWSHTKHTRVIRLEEVQGKQM
ncbi:glycosyl transferase family 2 [Cohnella sp. CIP 111063]|jgi:cellulose synthase/poly-beta-1,6-N-acetylglucosamine synthase-like glycosyltransferase|uniref:glycosyltransferase family 2 protein n=1 Tax=unclassified Cohnella TaxID=2636738 RepID=UPI000B8BC145|nr:MULTISPECIES: glycosyltransferase family 2 protein [unclassified Cohnella]OXS58403.1 glycosyl transferase family 2 [Cohnella sp. CIP 111063]PRX71690.1 cellulose synthase/poly-beta-1,6-N-acetylglucosamine synthase-like glycosyltransferase [Cohnella sp. SGD-V74]